VSDVDQPGRGAGQRAGAPEPAEPLEQVGSGSMSAPPVVYLPVETDAEGQVTDIRMIKLADGRVALLAYTALDRFIDAWGEHQPWLLFESRKIGTIQESKHFDLKLLDVAVPESFRPGPEAAQAMVHRAGTR
jgi:hypothetical protein